MTLRSHLATTLALLSLTGCVRPTIAPSLARTSAEISEQDLRHRLFAIAHDSLMGRETGSEGAFKATSYIAAEFARLGLQPAGDGGTYFQIVPMWRAAVDPQSRIEVAGTTLEVGRDFLPGSVAAPSRVLDNTPVIYGGPALDTSRWIATERAAGKIVVLDMPADAAPRGIASLGTRWRGAIAVAIVMLDRVGAETATRLRVGRPTPDSAPNASAMPVLWVTRRAAAVLLGAAPETLTPGAAGATTRGRFGIMRTPVAFPARNVVAILRGSDPALRAQYLALTAHNDHVGFDHSPVDHDSLRAFNTVVRPMGADSPPRDATPAEWSRVRVILDSLRRMNPPRLDSIRNGADDDGSGTAAILEIAERLAGDATRPRRSLLFVSHTGEEAGLLGSRWYADQPTVPRDSIVAEIDQDMIGRGTSRDFPRDGTGAGSDTYLEVVGAKRLSRAFGEMLEAANARQPIPFVFDYTYDQPGHPLQYYCRADHYNYARYGIPSVSISRGEHQDYHQITDEAQYISYRDLARVARMVHDGARAIADAAERPKLDAPKPTDPNVVCRQ
ncbi:MAG: M28 family peptidase [Gemmatimonadaceae bacterium]